MTASTSVLAVDIGGTTIKGGLLDRTGAVLDRLVRPTPVDEGADAIVHALASVVGELLPSDGEVLAAGVVLPGLVDSGVVRYAANLPLRDVDIRARLEERLGVPVAVGHDVSCAAEAEAAASGCAQALFVSIGTGVAAANVRDGRADRGALGQAGEIGHLVVVPAGELCPCGNRGCLERYASAAAIGRRWRALTGELDAGAERVAALVGTDPRASALWQEALDALAAGVAAAVCVLDPPLVVLGGGLSAAGDVLLDPLRSSIARSLRWRPSPEIRVARLGAAAGLHGAARLAWQRAADLPARRRAAHDETKERSA